MKKIFFAALSLFVSIPAMAELDRHDYTGLSERGQELMVKHACTTCHAMEKPGLAPALMDIADRYREKKTYKYHGYTPKHIWTVDLPLVPGLVKKISHGGVGDWKNIPMPQMDPKGYNKGEMVELIKSILAIEPRPEEVEEDEEPVASVSADKNKELADALAEIKALKAKLESEKKVEVAQPSRIKTWNGNYR